VAGREEECEAWQADVHIPELLAKVSGFASATRYRQVEGAPGLATYLTVYELSGPVPEVLAELTSVLPGLQQSDSLDVVEHPPTLMVYETL
jgi:hypothetical protein